MTSVEDLAVRALRKGDRAALERLFGDLRDPLYHFLFRHLGNPSDAEDAAQETFRQALGSLWSLKEPRAFRGWIYRIGLRVAWQMRQARVSPRDLPPTKEPAPMNDHETLKLAVNKLDDDLRTTVLLRYEQDLSYGQIAEAMECPEGTVAKRLHTAHGRLRELLAGAGLALALGAISSALATMPRTKAPSHLAEVLEKMVRETRIAPAGSGPSIAAKAALMTAAAVLIIAGFFVVHRSSKTAAVPMVASRGTQPPPPKETTRIAAVESAGVAPVKVAALAGWRKLSGSVTNRATGLRIPEARIELTPKKDDGKAIEARADGSGAYSITAPPGDYTVDVAAPGFVKFRFERAVESNRAGEYPKEDAPIHGEIDLHIEPGQDITRDFSLVPGTELRGIVLDPLGVPVADAKVEFNMHLLSTTPESQCTYSYTLIGGNTRLTGPDGKFTMSGLFPEGTCSVVISKRGFEKGGAQVILGPDPTDATFMVKPGLDLTIRVVDREGRPVAGAVFLAGTDSFRECPERTDAEGRVVLRDLRHEYRYVACTASGHGATLQDLKSLGGTDFEMVLPNSGARVLGRVLDSAGTPLKGVRVSVHHYALASKAQLVFTYKGEGGTCGNSAGCIVGFLPEEVVASETQTREDGRFELEGIPTAGGDVCLEFSLAGYEEAHRLSNGADIGEITLKATPKRNP